jgi:16S rRNA (uracil1498-N3)-methyltransferase
VSNLKRVLCQRLPEPHRPIELAETEATHATRVLRLKDGDVVEALDGKGGAATATLRTRNGPTRLEFLEKTGTAESSQSQLVPVVLEMSVLKGDAMEWVIEKAVELGIQTLVPVLTAHTVVQMDRKGPEAFQERWQKIADQALKQCGRLARLEVKVPTSFEQILITPLNGVRIWCDEVERDETPGLLSWLEKSRGQNRAPLHVLIGPEGGWSENERGLLARELAAHSPPKLVMASLGPLVLRAETAAVFAMSLLSANFRAQD